MSVEVEALERNVGEFGVPYIPLNDPRQGIVHVVGPELGFTLPGTTIVCGDSHTSTHGAFGALAFGIGTSEVEQVLATQCIVQRRAKSMLVHVEGVLGFGVTAKDLILAIVARIGASGAAGHVVEYAGPGISALDMSERMTVCNMSLGSVVVEPLKRGSAYKVEVSYIYRNMASCANWEPNQDRRGL